MTNIASGSRLPIAGLTKVAWVVVWAFLVYRLAPHLGAALGVESGASTSPAYTVTALDGATLTNETLKGRVVLVNFWATWCLPCRAEMPLLQAMYLRHRDSGLVVLGLSADVTGDAAVRQFLHERSITYPVSVVGPSGADAFGGVRGYPTSLLIDRRGRIRHRALGPLAMLSFEPAVRRLLAEAP